MTIGMLLQGILFVVDAGLSLVAAVVAVAAFADCLRRPARMFEVMGKRTKGFWSAITGVAALVCVGNLLALVSFTLRHGIIAGHFSGQIFQVVAVIAAGIYLADVKRALA